MTESTLTYYSARPLVSVGGRLEPRLGDDVVSVLVEETMEGLARCEISVMNWGVRGSETGHLYFDRQLLDFGKEIAVELGPPRDDQTVFRGRIMGIEAEFAEARDPRMTLLAEDRLQDLRQTRRTRSFQRVTDADAVREIASAHGLRAEIDHDGTTHLVLSQLNQSDLAFLRERARAADALVWLEGDAIHFRARARAERGAVELRYGAELREFSVLADLAHQRTRVEVTGWDVGAKEPIRGEAREEDMSSELGGRAGGGGILRQAVGERVEQIAHLVPFSEAEAREHAATRYREMARRFVVGTGHADGDPRIRVGSVVRVLGVGPLFDGAYAVTEVRHTFDLERGYRTTFRVERPGIGA